MRFASGFFMLGQAHDLLDLRRRDYRFTAAALPHPGVTPTDSPILVFATPSAAINNAVARRTSRCGTADDRDSTANDAR